MFPLYDDKFPTQRIALGTIGLIVLNVLVFFGPNNIDQLGLIPNEILQGQKLYTLITALFLHADIFHLIGNMWFLWIFGDNIEGFFGTLKFIIIYLALGVIASFGHILTTDQASIPVIGASGAISGLLGMYFWMFTRNRIRAFYGFIFYKPVTVSTPAYFFIGLWFLLQFVNLGDNGVAYGAHIAGFIAGVIAAAIFGSRAKIIDYYKIGDLVHKIERKGWGE